MSTDTSARRRNWSTVLSFRNVSAIYIFIVLFLVFSLWIPAVFLQAGVWRSLLDSQAITVIAALGLLIPLVTGSFNLAIGAEVGFGGILVAILQVRAGVPYTVAIPLTLLAGAAIGLVSGLIITKARIDSFIATLGLSSVLLAGFEWMSGNQQVIGLQSGFANIAVTSVGGVTVPTIVMLVVAALVFYVLECTSVGRRMYAAGYNADAARLAGVNVIGLRVGALVAGGAIAAGAGLLLSSRLNAGDPSVGPGLLLPAFSAVFLGSTQFRGGRFNVWGTLVAVYVLATGITGLQLVGSPPWISDAFNGIALLVAVGLSQWERTARRADAIGRALPWRGRPHVESSQAAPGADDSSAERLEVDADVGPRSS
jgi:ribose transport system permease protein